MSATPGGKRNKLKEILPLDMPLLIQIFPVYGCNFKCEFCIHGLDRSKHGYISDKTVMDMDLYRKIIDDIRITGKKVKMLRFAAIGEPLLHKNIADMVRIAKQADVAESIDIVTNGSLLTRELSDALITAGLSRLRISVEGLSDEDYKNRCQCNVNFDAFVDNIAYFYQNRRNTEVYIKIIDYMVQKEDECRRFLDIFEPISDVIAIEHLTPTVSDIDYEKVSSGMELNKGQNGEQLLDAVVCPQGFYMMQINPDGKVVPCCSMKYPAVLGDVYQDSVQQIWKGAAFNLFRQKLLHSRNSVGSVCAECLLYRYDLQEEDILDDVADVLIEKYK